jgi:hypothetical protein
MTAADIDIVHKMPALDIQAVARRRIAMRDQYAVVAVSEFDIGLDQIGTAAHVRRDLGRNMPDTGVEYELPAVMRARGVLGKSRPEPVIERQNLVGFRLPPPFRDHRVQAFRILLCQVLGLGKIAVEVVELPGIFLE